MMNSSESWMKRHVFEKAGTFRIKECVRARNAFGKKGSSKVFGFMAGRCDVTCSPLSHLVGWLNFVTFVPQSENEDNSQPRSNGRSTDGFTMTLIAERRNMIAVNVAQSGRLAYLDAIRGLAALSVVFFHYFQAYGPPPL